MVGLEIKTNDIHIFTMKKYNMIVAKLVHGTRNSTESCVKYKIFIIYDSEGAGMYNKRLTEEGGGIDGGGSARVHPGEPGRHDTGSADDAEIPSLSQHRYHQRR